ncbi:PspC domain-containing protein [uncultured Microscilla sp.]|uniref:PspC domain-containing protein n=1 Tax=uncultured Microscilla sp. TaxID=432653 RepID=UPI00261D633E|nr:PspC domain-containing protein [uncultured Microscilla sp.]
MKKNISINISGIIFYIEEDTYEQLKTYLSSVEQYFASFEDSKEIIEDIENRMAEIFMSTLNSGKQVITQEDVNHLITTMGSVADFQAMEDDPAYQPIASNPVFNDGGLELQTEAEYQASLQAQPTKNPPVKKTIQTEKAYTEDLNFDVEDNHRHTAEHVPQAVASQVPRRTRGKRLYRDGNHKILGGVASGLAHYFNMDAMWVRLILIVLTFGLFFAPAIPAFTLISYITLWAVVPLNKELEENPQIKRFYRDRNHSTIGGVVAGLSHYVGIELALLRLLFVLGIALGGASILLYIILWIISPEAKTITDRMKMEGEPITLKNIDSTLRKTMGVPKQGNYSTTKAGQVVMFPFKMAGVLINSLSPLIRPFFVLASESIRIGGGFLAFIMGLSMTVGLTIAVIFTLGNFHFEGMYLGPVPARFYYNSMELPALLATSMYFTLLIPSLFIIGLGISLLLRRWVIRARFGWTMAGLWVVSLIGLGVALPPNINNFGYTNTSGKVEYYTFEGKAPVMLDLNQNNGMKDYRRSRLTLQGYGEAAFKLEHSFGAAGESYQDAANNAQMIEYGVAKEDNTLLFDRNFTFKPKAKFRAQSNKMRLYIPYEKEFIMTNSLRHIIYNTINKNGYSARDMDGKNVWKFKKSGRLVCISCKHSPDEEKIARYENRRGYYNDNDNRVSHEEQNHGDGTRAFKVNNFKKLTIGGVFKVKLVKSNETKVVAKGREADLDKLKLTQNGEQVKLSFKRGSYRNIVLEISTPSLEALNLSGACKLTARGFSEGQMNLDISGASKVELKDGNADNVKLNISGASKIMAYDFAVKNAELELSGASKVYVQVANKLSVEASGASKVRYKGNPTLQSNSSGVSSVRKAD